MGQSNLDQDHLTTTLKHILLEVQHAYIIIDALDECTERENLLKLVEEILDWKISTLHILVTSQKEPDIEDCLASRSWHALDLQEAVVAADIQIHVRDRLQSDSQLKKWPAKMRAEIEATLSDGAHGMYAPRLVFMS
jgi:hypothetical protein